MSVLVRRQWRCGYVEISAKYNWGVTQLFRELMTRVDNRDRTFHVRGRSLVADVWWRGRCAIL